MKYTRSVIEKHDFRDAIIYKDLMVTGTSHEGITFWNLSDLSIKKHVPMEESIHYIDTDSHYLFVYGEEASDIQCIKMFDIDTMELEFKIILRHFGIQDRFWIADNFLFIYGTAFTSSMYTKITPMVLRIDIGKVLNQKTKEERNSIFNEMYTLKLQEGIDYFAIDEKDHLILNSFYYWNKNFYFITSNTQDMCELQRISFADNKVVFQNELQIERSEDHMYGKLCSHDTLFAMTDIVESIKIIDMTKKEIIRTIRIEQGGIEYLSFLNDFLFVGDQDGTIMVFNTKNGECVHTAKRKPWDPVKKICCKEATVLFLFAHPVYTPFEKWDKIEF